MTWVVGASTIWGYGVVISDMQVAFSDGTTADILQKPYPMNNFIIAGSVKIGFMLLESLAQFVQLPPNKAATHAWDPLWVSNNWWPLAQEVFESAPEPEKKLG